ncbi:MAG: hypothetical protein Q7J72_05450 [Candidatus Omnitrophota bacterium]|nr:hypothetical protein [Candidatus Omnitrophota bacterium]
MIKKIIRNPPLTKGRWGGVLILLILFLELLNNPGFAAQKKRRIINESGRPEAVVKESGSAAKQLLKSQEWIIYLVPINDESAKPQMDILSFSNNKFNSRNLSSKGFKEFDYSLSEADGAISWEASQAIESGEIASWHAELKDKLMRGVLSILKKDGTIEDLYFTTQAAKEDALTPKQPDQKPKKAR